MDGLSSCRQLKTVRIVDCVALRNIDALSGLEKVERVSLSQLDGLTELRALSGLPSLKRLAVSHCKGIRDLSPLSELPALEEILWDDDQIIEIPEALRSKVKKAQFFEKRRCCFYVIGQRI